MRPPQRQDCPCPAHIIDYVETTASLCGKRARVASADEVKSAQQQVFILTLCFEESKTDHCSQQRGEETVPPSNENTRQISARIQTAISKGNNKIVARVWKGSARWWNLNTNDASGTMRGKIDIARSEVAGYRIARAAMSTPHASANAGIVSSENDKVIIPEVIYFSCDYRGDKANSVVETVEHRQREEENPWAILSYVGEDSCYFQGNTDGNDSSPQHSSPWIFDGQYAKDMVKIRHEFGFDEPHPRWGRVKEDQALNYAIRVLDRVILPIQSTFSPSIDIKNTCDCFGGHEEDLVVLGRPSSMKPKPFRFIDMVAIYCDAATKMSKTIHQTSDAIDNTTAKLLSALHICIENLANEAKACAYLSGSDVLPASLCHMDVQPQNLILRRHKGEEYDVNVVPFVSSVLDWEEACYADPRFEVLLMARKVCANRKQADKLWEHYSHQLKKRHNLDVGPIEPWLKLETTHSITTLLLQNMNLVGGGRNPWESKPDLLGKIEREFSRLEALGWDIAM